MAMTKNSIKRDKEYDSQLVDAYIRNNMYKKGNMQHVTGGVYICNLRMALYQVMYM